MSNSIIVRQEIGRADIPPILAGAPMHKPKHQPEPVFIQHLSQPGKGIVCGAARVDVGEGRWAPRASLRWVPPMCEQVMDQVTCWNCRQVVDA